MFPLNIHLHPYACVFYLCISTVSLSACQCITINDCVLQKRPVAFACTLSTPHPQFTSLWYSCFSGSVRFTMSLVKCLLLLFLRSLGYV